MSPAMARGKPSLPGPQSAYMIKYLEELANHLSVNQLEQPCTAVSSTMRNIPNCNVAKRKTRQPTLDGYFLKK